MIVLRERDQETVAHPAPSYTECPSTPPLLTRSFLQPRPPERGSATKRLSERPSKTGGRLVHRLVGTPRSGHKHTRPSHYRGRRSDDHLVSPFPVGSLTPSSLGRGVRTSPSHPVVGEYSNSTETVYGRPTATQPKDWETQEKIFTLVNMVLRVVTGLPVIRGVFRVSKFLHYIGYQFSYPTRRLEGPKSKNETVNDRRTVP